MKPKKWMGKVMLGLLGVGAFVVTGEFVGYLEAAIMWSVCIFLAVFFQAALYLIFEGED